MRVQVSVNTRSVKYFRLSVIAMCYHHLTLEKTLVGELALVDLLVNYYRFFFSIANAETVASSSCKLSLAKLYLYA